MIPNTLENRSLIANVVLVDRAMRHKPEKVSLPSVEVLALVASVVQRGSSFLLPFFYGRARCLQPFWEVLGLPGGGGDDGLCVRHIDLNNCVWGVPLRTFSGRPRIQVRGATRATRGRCCWASTFNLNAALGEARLFGDNAVALVQFLRCKAAV